MNKVGAIILAAGKGKRMNSKTVNKVVLPLENKPMILHTLDLLKKFKIDPIIVVVGFAKKSVMEVLGDRVTFAEQKKQLGTAHAVLCAFRRLPQNIDNVLIVNGDDSAFYKEQMIKKLVETHFLVKASFTFLTIELENPSGLGRVIRNKKGEVMAVIEEEDATKKQKEIKEINPACYIFRVNFLKEYLKKVKKSPVTGEYYLTSLVNIAVKNKEKIETVRGGKIAWRGVNTKKELRQAERLFLERNF